MKIKYYFVTGETNEIDVDETLYNEMREITRKTNTVNKQEQRKKQSIDAAIEDGKIEYRDENENLQKRKMREHRLELLPAVIDMLDENQKDLVNRVFFNGESLTDYAEREKVSVAAIHYRIKVIKKRLKKLLEK